MNTTVSTAPGRRHRPPPAAPENENAHQPVNASGLPREAAPIDRLALRVGIALVRWGRRPRPSREARPDWPGAHAARHNRERTAERERAAERQYLLMTSFR